MKSCILCLLLVSMVVLNSEVKAERNRIHPGVLNPCKRPGGPHPGCNGDVKSPPQPANPYNRGCSMILRCRRGHDKVHNHKVPTICLLLREERPANYRHTVRYTFNGRIPTTPPCKLDQMLVCHHRYAAIIYVHN
ncbi:hypothetical protein ACFXTN_007241 [Malus domestica]